MLSLFQLIQLCGFSFLLAVGQILFKLAAMKAPALNSVASVLSLAHNSWFWAAMAVYTCTTLLWINALQTVPLSVAYPFIALGFIFVPLAAFFLFNEPLGLKYGIGIILILIALKLITGGQET
jgi:multidrug transporter EmrE-like cation transporter